MAHFTGLGFFEGILREDRLELDLWSTWESAKPGSMVIKGLEGGLMTGVKGRFAVDEEWKDHRGPCGRELRELGETGLYSETEPGFYFKAPLSNKCLFKEGGSIVTLSFSPWDWARAV